MLALLMHGRTNDEIAAELGIGEKTLRICLTAVYAKTGSRNRTQAAVWGVRRAASGDSALVVELREQVQRLTRECAYWRKRAL